MTHAVLPMPGTVWSGTSLPTSALTNYTRKFAAGFAFPFDQFVDGLANDLTLTARATASAIEQDRFDRPMQTLYEALAEAQEAAVAFGNQAIPNAPTIREARKVLRMLPRDVPMPEPVVEPSGAIAWAWERPDDAFLVLAVNGTGVVQRSAVIDGDERHGRSELTDRFTPDELTLLASFRLAHG